MCVARLRVIRCCRSLQQLFVVMVILASFSTLLTYQIGTYLPWTDSKGTRVQNPQPPGLENHRKVGNIPVPRQQQLEDHHKHRHLSQASKSAQILTRLLQLEDQLIAVSNRRKVLVLGSNESFSPEADTLRRSFHENDLKMVANIERPGVPINLEKDTSLSREWSMIWCLSHNCTSNLLRHIYQLVNWIPTLASQLMSPAKLCLAQTSLQNILDELSPYSFCMVMSDSKTLLQPPKYPSPSLEYAITPRHSRLDDVTVTRLLHQTQIHLEKDTVVWTSPRGFLLLGNHSLALRLSVLVSSLSPLRVYLHPKGSRLGQQSFKEHNTILTVRRAITQEYGQQAATKWWLNLQHKLVALLLSTELDTHTSNDSEACGCPRCSQLLDIDVIFTTDFQTIILQVSVPEFTTRLVEVLEDTVTMMASVDRIAMDVAAVLDNVGQDVYLANQDCPGSFGVCLTDHDLVYLLDNKQQFRAPTQFLKIYPHLKSSQYAGVINKLRQTSILSRSGSLHQLSGVELSTNDKQSICHMTSDLHSLLTSMENSYLDDRSDQGPTLEEKVVQRPRAPVQPPLQKAPTGRWRPGQLDCSNDPRDAPYLSSIQTIPELSLTPNFDPSHLTYHAEVDYDMFLLRITAKARSCKYEARIDTGDSKAQMTNYTLGVGDNLVHVLIVDPAQPQSWVVSTYTITIRRRASDFYLPKYSKNMPLLTCTLKQDCSLHFDPSQPCGLQPVTGKVKRWSAFTEISSHLPQCGDSDNPVWYVPCENCRKMSSCYWKQARWQTSGCTSQFLSAPQVQKCLAGRKLLFIGDSTNRGILHYILERINGSLTQWDKTHNLKIYRNVNNNSTVLSFAYYPQFWLPTDHRPAFDKAVYQIIRSTMPLENSTNTVLVVGGVHWLGKHHLSLILQALNRERLTGIRLVMKGLGAGFHQLVNGVRFAPMEEQRRLLGQERETAQFATQHGFGVVPTYNMTMARYKDFLQGKCACHFHKITEKYAVPTDEMPSYHVEGDINRWYSELVINQICQHRAPD
ncbi:cadherin-like and PC-esterase domain-containing protein 1 [Ylistrum balloti]|uniref:cadherin-like and PC-esterase domain-containing protein 1 n=1 Tax=Ylistrum balloti TaxID=509963 RepID=UPI002905F719|nr:cadherin-like and PC-esterase domain-containing protein 1 [Ylistrum balloti]